MEVLYNTTGRLSQAPGIRAAATFRWQQVHVLALQALIQAGRH